MHVLPHEGPSAHAVFMILTLNVCTRVLLALTELLTNGFFVYLFSSPKMRDPLRPKSPQKYKNRNIWRNKNKKKLNRTSNGPAGAHIICVPNSGYISKTRRERWLLSKFGVVCLKQPLPGIKVCSRFGTTVFQGRESPQVGSARCRTCSITDIL